MPSLKQTNILAQRFGISTPPGSRLAKRTFIGKPHKTSPKRRHIVPLASVRCQIFSDRIPLKQLNLNFKPKEITIGMRIIKIEPTGPSTPELIEEDVEIEVATFRVFLRHVDSLDMHSDRYSGYCSRGASQCSTPM